MLPFINNCFHFLHKKFLRIIQYLQSKGFFDLLSVNFLTQFLGFGTVLLVAKFLTPVELGEVKILQSYVEIFAILAGFGFNTAVLKVCAEERSDFEKAGILRFAFNRVLITTLITLVIVVALSLSGVLTSSKRLSFWLIIYCGVIPFQVLTGIFIVYLQSQKKIKEMARAQAFIKIQSFIVIVISTWLWGFKGFVFATITAYALGLWPFFWQIGVKFLNILLDKKPQQFMQYAIFGVIANGITQLGQRGDVLILDHFSNDRETIGYYALAITFVTAARMVTGTVQSITTPYFTENAQKKFWFRNQLLINQLRLFFLSLIVAIGLYFFAYAIIPIIYGSDYSHTLTYLAILLIGYIIWSSGALIGIANFSLGFVKYNTISVLITTPISLTLSYIFLTKFGILGIAWAQVISAIVTISINIIFFVIVVRKAFPK